MGQMNGRLSAEDLMLVLGPMPAGGIRAWLYEGLRERIRGESLAAGTSLPSSRQVAAALGVARGTVTGALDLLVDEGFLVSRPRSGLVVAALGGRAQTVPAPVRVAPASPGTPDPALFPHTGWTKALRQAMRDLGPRHLGYQDPQGLPELREVVADHLRRTRGAVAQAQDVIVVNGVAQAQSLLASVLSAGGNSTVAVEDPGSPGTRALLEAVGMEVLPVPVDGDGLMVGAIPPRAGAVVVTPAHQFPTGCVLSSERRRELVERSAGSRLIIEDDYDAELRFDRRPVPALQALAPDSVALVGSVSKTLAPSFRLGWLIAPKHLLPSLVSAKRYADLGTGVVDQLALAHFLGSGAYQRHVRSVRSVYQRRRRELLTALAFQLPELRVLGVEAGLHVVVELPDPVAEAAAVDALTAAGVACHGYSDTFDGVGRPGVVLGTARTGVEVVGLLREVLHPKN